MPAHINKELSFPKPDVFAEKDLKTQWPDDFFDLFGAWEGEPLTRLEQSESEQRLEID